MNRRTAVVFGAGLLVAVLLGGLLLMVRSATGRSAEQVVCRTSVTAGLTDGPHAPLDLSGDVELLVQPDQSFTGVLTLKTDGSKIGIKGQGAGRGIDIIFEPPGGKQLFAHGVLEHPIWECQGNAGGPLVGPDYGDQGDWTTYPPFIRVISGTTR